MAGADSSLAGADSCAGADSLTAGVDSFAVVVSLAGADFDVCGACAGGRSAALGELVEELLLVEEDAPVRLLACPRALFALAAVAEPLFTADLPGKACAATSVSTPVMTTLPAINIRFTRPSLCRAASRVRVV